METKDGSIGIATDSMRALQEVTDLLNSPAASTRAGLYDAATQVTRVHNMLQALNLEIANQYRDLVTANLGTPDPQGRKAPLTGQRLTEQTRKVTGQDLSPAWHLTPHFARVRVGLARTATDLLPKCLEQVRRGEATEDHLSAVLREAVVLEPEDQARIDTDLASQLPGLTVKDAKAAAFKRAAELDAATMVERAERAAQHAHVSVRPAPDCMTRLSALLPLKDGIAINVALTRHAQRAKAHGDPRNIGHIKAALLVQWVRDGATRADHDQSTWNHHTPSPASPVSPGGPANPDTAANPTSTAPPGSQHSPTSGTGVGHGCSHGPGVEVLVTITDLGLLGFSDTPAHVDGYGAVPTGLARQIIKDAAAEDRATLRRLWTSPRDGTLTQMESKSRIFPKGLARFIRTRDQVCTTPYCGAPIRQIDHITPHAAGGPTTAANGQGLCTACNQTKEHTTIRTGVPPGQPGPSGHPDAHQPAGPSRPPGERRPAGPSRPPDQPRPPEQPHETPETVRSARAVSSVKSAKTLQSPGTREAHGIAPPKRFPDTG